MDDLHRAAMWEAKEMRMARQWDYEHAMQQYVERFGISPELARHLLNLEARIQELEKHREGAG
jgi:hypothetical protein